MLQNREYTLEFDVTGTPGKAVKLEFEAGVVYNQSISGYERAKKTVTLSSSRTHVSMTFTFKYDSSLNPNSYHALTAYTKWSKNEFISFSNFAIYQTVSYNNKVPLQSPAGNDSSYYINSTSSGSGTNIYQWSSSNNCLPANLSWSSKKITDSNGNWIYLDNLWIHWAINNN